MILVENINFLRKNFSSTREKMKAYENQNRSDTVVEIVPSRCGEATLKVSRENKELFIHSKYDPFQEAERLIDQFHNELSEYDHVFFYGIGLGYHIEKIAARYPNLSFTLYEPSMDIFSRLIETRSLVNIGKNKIKQLFVEVNEREANGFIDKFSRDVSGKTLFLALPSYQRAFSKQYSAFAAVFSNAVKSKRTSYQTNWAFEKRWVINSLMNFNETFNTENILSVDYKKQFKNKPAILVAAGPSLYEEIERLRYIKENKLAYIFSVGSAINTLVEYNIYPDAACTYDPTQRNQVVFEKTIEKQVDKEIPLIFGSSVGFETLQKYNGVKIHMLTSQDTISGYFLKHKAGEEIDFVLDAPSIAVVTLQLLNELGCSPIILVGQNLAYKNKERYSKGINYKHSSIELNDRDIEQASEIVGVDGELVLTNETFIGMKKQLEMVISKYNKGENQVINTTQGGVNIEGTYFQSLEAVIEQKLVDSIEEVEFVSDNEGNYCMKYLREQKENMDLSVNEFLAITNKFFDTLKRIDDLVNKGDSAAIQAQIVTFDKLFKKLAQLDFYKVFMHPMLRVQHEITNKKAKEIRFEKNIVTKGKKITAIFSSYFSDCKKYFEQIYPLYNKIFERLLSSENEGEGIE